MQAVTNTTQKPLQFSDLTENEKLRYDDIRKQIRSERDIPVNERLKNSVQREIKEEALKRLAQERIGAITESAGITEAAVIEAAPAAILEAEATPSAPPAEEAQTPAPVEALAAAPSEPPVDPATLLTEDFGECFEKGLREIKVPAFLAETTLNPFSRVLTSWQLKMAEVTQYTAKREAIKAASKALEALTVKRPQEVTRVLDTLREAWDKIDRDDRDGKRNDLYTNIQTSVEVHNKKPLSAQAKKNIGACSNPTPSLDNSTQVGIQKAHQETLALAESHATNCRTAQFCLTFQAAAEARFKHRSDSCKFGATESEKGSPLVENDQMAAIQKLLKMLEEFAALKETMAILNLTNPASLIPNLTKASIPILTENKMLLSEREFAKFKEMLYAPIKEKAKKAEEVLTALKAFLKPVCEKLEQIDKGIEVEPISEADKEALQELLPNRPQAAAAQINGPTQVKAIKEAAQAQLAIIHALLAACKLELTEEKWFLYKNAPFSGANFQREKLEAELAKKWD